MKCDNLIIVESRRRRGSGKPYLKAVKFQTWHQREILKQAPLEEGVVCGGKIDVNISAQDIADWGGHYAELKVSFLCERCGCTFYFELAQADLDTLVTDMLAKMPQKKMNELRAIVVEGERLNRENLARWKKESEERVKA